MYSVKDFLIYLSETPSFLIQMEAHSELLSNIAMRISPESNCTHYKGVFTLTFERLPDIVVKSSNLLACLATLHNVSAYASNIVEFYNKCTNSSNANYYDSSCLGKIANKGPRYIGLL